MEEKISPSSLQECIKTNGNKSKIYRQKFLFKYLVITSFFVLSYFTGYTTNYLLFNPGVLDFGYNQVTGSFTISTTSGIGVEVWIDKTDSELMQESGFINSISPKNASISSQGDKTFSVSITNPSGTKTYGLPIRCKFNGDKEFSYFTYTIQVQAPPAYADYDPRYLTVNYKTSTHVVLSWTRPLNNDVDNYSIYMDNVKIGTTTSKQYTAMVDGGTNGRIYSFKVFNNNQHGSFPSNTINVLVHPSFNINGSYVFCNNQTGNYSATQLSNATYRWTAGSNISLDNTTSTSTTVTASSTYNGETWIKLTRTLTVSGKTEPISETKPIWIGAPSTPFYISPFTGGGYIVAGNTQYSVSTSCPGGVNFNWSVAGGTITSGQGEQDAILQTLPCSPNYSINFNISVSAQNACGSSPYFTEYGDIPIGDPGDPGNTMSKRYDPNINKPNNTTIAYPNPTNGVINIGSTSNVAEAILYDMQGRMLQKEVLGKNKNCLMDISNHSSNTYVLILKLNDGTTKKELVVLIK